jgi:hypothetical protein
MKNNIKILAMLICLFTLSASLVFAVSEPEGPSINEVSDSRRQAAAVTNNSAYAGNITHLILTGTTVTQTWQGYVGNISGVITLDNSNSDTLYNWTLADPEGEVYASYIQNIDWTTGNVLCWNWSNSDELYLQLAEYEGSETTYGAGPNATTTKVLGLAADDVDGVDETFHCKICGEAGDGLDHSSFYVGGQQIVGTATEAEINGPCPYLGTTTTRGLFNSTGDGVFEEVLLYHDDTGIANDGVIYTAILKQSVTGYDGGVWDFQMLVGEDGHNGNTDSTPYFFYVELE